MPNLTAKVREVTGRKTYALREDGQIPAVIYGAIATPKNISVDAKAFVKLYQSAGESTVIDLDVDGSVHHVLIQDFQQDPLRDTVTHVDFRAIDMDKVLETEIKLRFLGESTAVKALGGTLVEAMGKVRVSCLPKYLVPFIDIDISKLATFEDSIRIKDLPAMEGVTILENPNQTIVLVQPPRTEEELAALDQAVEADVTKVEIAGKKPEEEAAEGEGEAGAAAPAAGAEKGAKAEEKKPEKK
jgi:large subunit ribosomal protein L25